MEDLIPCVFPDDDEARTVIEELEARGVREEVVTGPADVHLDAEDTDAEARAVRRAALAGAPLGAAVMVAFVWWLMPSPPSTEGATILVAALGAVVGMIAGAFGGTLLSTYVYTRAEEDVHLDRGEVLVMAHSKDRDAVQELMESHGARCYLTRSGQA